MCKIEPCTDCIERQYPSCSKNIPCCRCDEDECSSRQPCHERLKAIEENTMAENLIEWSMKMQGAREMLGAIIRYAGESGGCIKLENGKYSKVYTGAIVRLAMSSNDAAASFLQHRRISYFGHAFDKKGKLIRCEARFE